jgi:hypothetical protein
MYQVSLDCCSKTMSPPKALVHDVSSLFRSAEREYQVGEAEVADEKTEINMC